MDQALQAFIAKVSGQQNIGDTPQNTGECVGLWEVWTDSLNLPHTWGNAKDLLTGADTSKFDVIYNDPNNTSQFPAPGDGVVFSGKFNNGIGHTGISTDQTTGTKLVLFEQNDPLSSTPHIQEYDYTYVVGWLHPINADPLVCDPASVRDMLVGKAAKYDEFVAAGFTQANDATDKVKSMQTVIDGLNINKGDMQKDLDSRQAAINTLNLKVQSLSNTISQDAIEDHDTGVKLSDTEHARDTALALLQSHYKQVSAVDENTYQKDIKTLLKPIQQATQPEKPISSQPSKPFFDFSSIKTFWKEAIQWITKQNKPNKPIQ